MRCADIRRVIGRPDALRLCRDWLRQLLVSTVELEEAEQPLASGAPPEADLASAFLVEAHTALPNGIKVLAAAPEDLVEVARCAVIAKSASAAESAPSGADKTLIYFTLSTGAPGSLAQTLDTLHRHGVNLLNIRSYASDLKGGSQSDFLLTAEGHEHEPALAGALADLSKTASGVKVIGSFKRVERASSQG